jgi:hypothetical protein
LPGSQNANREPQNPRLVPHKTPNVKQAICRPHTVLLITLGVNLIFCPVIASFPLIKERTSQRYSFFVSVPAASKKNSLKVKTTKNIDIKQGLISKLHVLQT